MQSSPKIQKAFALLGLKDGAAEDEVKRAFRKYVKIHHPDRYSADPYLEQLAAEQFKQINNAYELIKAYLSTVKPPKDDPRSPVARTPAPVSGFRHTSKPIEPQQPAAKEPPVFQSGFRQALAKFVSGIVAPTPPPAKTNSSPPSKEHVKFPGKNPKAGPRFAAARVPKSGKGGRKAARIQPIGPITPVAPVKRVDQI